MHWQRATSSDVIGFRPDPSNVVHPDPVTTLVSSSPASLEGRWLVFRAEFDPAGIVDVLVKVHFADGSRALIRPTVIARNRFYGALKARMPVTEVTVEVTGSGAAVEPRSVHFGPETSRSHILPLLGRGIHLIVKHPKRLSGSVRWFLHRLSETKVVHLPPRLPMVAEANMYEHWIDVLDERPDDDRALHVQRLARLTRRPLISVLATAEDREEIQHLAADLETQIYPDWELVVATSGTVDRLEAGDLRVKAAPCASADPSAKRNAALAVASGELIVALPNGARLRSNALLEAALAFAGKPDTTLLYADEDFLDSTGRRMAPRFKPAWSPEVEATHDFIGDPTFVRAAVLRSLGGWREGLTGSEDHDLKLRLAETAPAQSIVHLAKILLHRSQNQAIAAEETRLRVVAQHLERSGIAGEVVADQRSPAPRIVRRVSPAPLVSLIIPTRDRAALLQTCLGTILDRTSYPAFEVIVVDNDSKDPVSFVIFDELQRDPRVRVLSCPGPFNYSALNNAASRQARGSVLALVNNDIEVITHDWLDEMVGYAVDPGIGCVGAKLYYPNGTLQHGSVVVGLGGGAGHVHKHAARTARGYMDRLTTVQNVSAVTAACLVVRKSVYEEVGGLDENAFKVAFNDVDFCLKVAEAGYRNVWTPFAELLHHESVSRGDDLKDRSKARRFADELSALQERWGTRLLFDPYYSPHLEWQTESVGIRRA